MVGRLIVMGECMAHKCISHNGAMRACHDMYLQVIRWIQHSKIMPDPHVHHISLPDEPPGGNEKGKPTIGSEKGELTNQEFPTNLFPFFSAS